MTYDPERHHRRSIRLAGRDYAASGAYFVTICTYDRELLFGHVTGGEMHRNTLGNIVAGEWMNTERIRPNVRLDAWVVMPNHLHGIIILRATSQPRNRATRGSLASPSQTIGAIVRGFKAAATRQVNAYRNWPGVTVWQRNYYEHIIRDEHELDRIRRYIATNPTRWEEDSLNPHGVPGL